MANGAATMPLNTLCPICTEPTAICCRGCRAIRYCSRECMEADYAAHRCLCGVGVVELRDFQLAWDEQEGDESDASSEEGSEGGEGVETSGGPNEEGLEVDGEAAAGQEEQKQEMLDLPSNKAAKHVQAVDEKLAGLNLDGTTKHPAANTKAPSVSSSPSQDETSTCTVVFFPADRAAGPFLINLPIHEERDPATGTLLCQQPQMQALMHGRLWPSTHIIDKNAATQQPLDYHIHLCHLMPQPSSPSSSPPSSPSSPLPLNTAILTATGHRAHHPWRGPLLAFRGRPDSTPTDPDILELLPMSPEAYSHTIAHLIDYANPLGSYLATLGPKIPAVKILCDGDLARDGGRRFRAVSLPRCHPCVRTPRAELSPIAARVGLGLVLARCEGAEEGDGDGDDDADADVDVVAGRANRFVTVMQTCIDAGLGLRGGGDQWPDDEGEVGFGFTRGYWARGVGTVVGFREDFGGVEVRVVERFAEFCDWVADRFLRRTVGGIVVEEEEEEEGLEEGGGGGQGLEGQKAAKGRRRKLSTREEALAEVTREKWEAFLTGVEE